jgi:hypothetical protein
LLRVFLSWSGERSKALAVALADWLPRVLPGSKPWISTTIPKGARWSDHVGEHLARDHVGIICVTPENTQSAWLMFEAGALSKSLEAARVCPVLLGLAATEVEGPLSQFQATVFERDDVALLAATLNQHRGTDAVPAPELKAAFDEHWPSLEAAVQQAARIPLGHESVAGVIRALSRFGLPEPVIGNSAFFAEGFESHGLYSTACEVAQMRLLVFGRKNRKLFDKEHASFFKALRGRTEQGFDFRCLFLNPDAPSHVLAAAHADDSFRDQLVTAITAAQRMLRGAGVEPSSHMRLYDVPRAFASVVVDDSVAYTPVRFAANGRSAPLTKSGFAVINGGSSMGQDLVSQFEDIWTSARPASA